MLHIFCHNEKECVRELSSLSPYMFFSFPVNYTHTTWCSMKTARNFLVEKEKKDNSTFHD
jgi:hypothetical protein